MHHYGYQYHVENEVFWGGINNGWEKVSMGLWQKLCKHSNNILDVGANTGVFSLVAKAVNPGSKVISFEPMPGIMRKLKYNVELNNYDVLLSDFALSDYDGTAIIYPTSLEHVYSVTVNKNMFPERKSVELSIKTIRLDHFIEENNIRGIDLMKIDVETHELQVLLGMGKYLAQFKPAMLIEIQNDEIADGVQKLVEGLGYLYFNIDENSGFRQTDKLGKSDYLNYLLCSREVAKKILLIS